MADPKTPQTDDVPADESSGAGYGNNTQTDDVGGASDPEDAAEAHPS